MLQEEEDVGEIEEEDVDGVEQQQYHTMPYYIKHNRVYRRNVAAI